jgi:drug/metabolite transporter (DMT)-like permease
MKKWITEFMLLSVVVIWGANYTIGKYGMVQLTPVLFNTIRFLIVFPILLVGTYILEHGISIDKKDIRRLILISVIGVPLYQTFFMMSVKYTTATNSSLLIAMSPIFSGIFATATGLEKFTWRIQIGSLLSFIGASTVIYAKESIHSNYPHEMFGNLMGLFASLSWGAYPILAKPLFEKYSALRVTAWSALIGTLALFLISIPSVTSISLELSALTWVSLLYSSILVTAYGLVAWYSGVRKIGPTNVMIYMYLIPLIAAIVAAFHLHEPIFLVQFIGGIIILIGLTIVKWPPLT